jgi:hypothetical protein
MSSEGLPDRSGVRAPLPNPTGQSPRAADPACTARVEASRRNGARSRGPKTPEGKARSARNALKHGLRAQKYVTLPEEDAAEFADLEAAMVEELAPEGALQTILARRVAVAAWRLARADRLEVELFAERHVANRSLGLALLGRRVGDGAPTPFRRPSDGNGTRSFETLLRYRGAAMAEFWRALRTLKALQAEQATTLEAAQVVAPQPTPPRPRAPAPVPNEPARDAEGRPAYAMPAHPAVACFLHEPAAPWLSNRPEPALAPHSASALAPDGLVPNEPACPSCAERT